MSPRMLMIACLALAPLVAGEATAETCLFGWGSQEVPTPRIVVEGRDHGGDTVDPPERSTGPVDTPGVHVPGGTLPGAGPQHVGPVEVTVHPTPYPGADLEPVRVADPVVVDPDPVTVPHLGHSEDTVVGSHTFIVPPVPRVCAPGDLGGGDGGGGGGLGERVKELLDEDLPDLRYIE